MHSLQLSVVVASFLFALPLLIVTGQHGFAPADPPGRSERVVAPPSAPVVPLRTLPSVAAPTR
ncbi:hypothetical protein [Rhodocyclus tenuis]|uniref:hypothetical protein n=1 Tax=Rhodocyclus tenuis TaxID=1066 RepID=UPI001905D0CD|nr:hypothetical protein [Rhodocyclus tenuis]